MQLKVADDKRRDIDALEELLRRPDVDRYTRQRIQADIRAIVAGIKGERDAAYEIEFYLGASKNYVTLHDLRIEYEGRVAQIDHLIVNRMLQTWVCESKHFGEGVSINEHGEWSSYFGGRPRGIPSPVEQNRKHIAVLEKVVDAGLVELPRRLGVRLKPEFRSLILVSNAARIGRPPKGANVDGMDTVMKAEQIKSRVMRDDDTSVLRIAHAVGTETLERFGRSLLALHRPGRVDWLARYGIDREARQNARFAPRSEPERSERPKSGHRCAACGAGVSFAVVKFCWNNKPRFSGRVFCMDCQKAVPA